jgi:hypothetical protein
VDEYVKANNYGAWAIGQPLKNGRFQVRRVVWGTIMARSEKREGEQIRRAEINVRKPIKQSK